MASKVYFKWASQEVGPIGEVVLGGQSIRLGDLRLQLLEQVSGGDYKEDFDLEIVDADKHKVLVDPNMVVSKNSTVIISRVPILTARYPRRLAPHSMPGPGSSLNVQREIQQDRPENTDDFRDVFGGQPTRVVEGTENIVAPVQETPVTRGFGRYAMRAQDAEASLLAAKPKRPIGVPKSLLEAQSDSNNAPVFVKPDNIAFDQKLKNQALQALNVESFEKLCVSNSISIPKELQCSLSGTLLKEPVRLPCCLMSCSLEKINDALISSGYECPFCKTPGISPEMLKADRILKDKVAVFVQEVQTRLEKVHDQSLSAPADTKFTAVSRPETGVKVFKVFESVASTSATSEKANIVSSQGTDRDETPQGMPPPGVFTQTYGMPWGARPPGFPPFPPFPPNTFPPGPRPPWVGGPPPYPGHQGWVVPPPISGYPRDPRGFRAGPPVSTEQTNEESLNQTKSGDTIVETGDSQTRVPVEGVNTASAALVGISTNENRSSPSRERSSSRNKDGFHHKQRGYGDRRDDHRRRDYSRERMDERRGDGPRRNALPVRKRSRSADRRSRRHGKPTKHLAETDSRTRMDKSDVGNEFQANPAYMHSETEGGRTTSSPTEDLRHNPSEAQKASLNSEVGIQHKGSHMSVTADEERHQSAGPLKSKTRERRRSMRRRSLDRRAVRQTDRSFGERPRSKESREASTTENRRRDQSPRSKASLIVDVRTQGTGDTVHTFNIAEQKRLEEEHRREQRRARFGEHQIQEAAQRFNGEKIDASKRDRVLAPAEVLEAKSDDGSSSGSEQGREGRGQRRRHRGGTKKRRERHKRT